MNSRTQLPRAFCLDFFTSPRAVLPCPGRIDPPNPLPYLRGPSEPELRPILNGSSAPRDRRVVAVAAAARAPAAPAAEAAPLSMANGAKAADAASGRGGGGNGAGSKGDWRHEIIAALAQAEGFAELTIRTKVGSTQPWHTITVRPVLLRGARHLQVTAFTARQSTAANHPVDRPGAADHWAESTEEAVGAVVRPLLEAGGLGSVALRTASLDLAVQITKRGKGIVHRSSPQGRPALVSSEPGGGNGNGNGNVLAHDRAKATPIPADQPHPFLQKIGFQTADGRIKANMQDKFSQVNEFLKLLGHTGLVRELLAARQQQQQQQQQHEGYHSRPLHILDCGCGSSHLSFGTYHYLNHVLGLPASLGGVDVNAGLMGRANANARALGLEGVRFDTAPIGEYSPPVRPDIVLALHACDTATDDSLALAVKQGSPLIMAVPCCHAHLHKQLAGRPPSSRPPWAPLLRHGILRQRQLDLLTDTLRAQLLRVAGYQTDVVEFVSTEHTPRNLLIRAVRQQPRQGQGQGQGHQQRQPATSSATATATATGASPPPSSPPPASPSPPLACSPPWTRQQLAAAREYVDLREYWGVVPRLEVLLHEQLGPLLEAAAAAAAAAQQQQQRQPPTQGAGVEDDDDDGVDGDADASGDYKEKRDG